MNTLVYETIDPRCPDYRHYDDRQPQYAPGHAHASMPPLFDGYCSRCGRRHPFTIRQMQATKAGWTMKMRHAAALFVLGEVFAITVLLAAAHALASK